MDDRIRPNSMTRGHLQPNGEGCQTDETKSSPGPGWLLTLALLSACRTEANRPDVQEAVRSAEETAPPAQASALLPRVAIASGKFESGTEPGMFERVPELEPGPGRAELGLFEIDTLPHPGKPDVAPTWVSSADEAARLCDEAGARLCTELEWERACKGPESTPFSTGDTWKCEAPEGCVSGFGVRGLGALPEWTGSRFGAASPVRGKAVVRGAPLDAPAEQHRCAHRSADVERATFRCCHGAPNALAVEEPSREKVYEKVDLPASRVRELLLAHPRTKPLADQEVELFAEPEAARTVVDRGPGDRKGFQFTVMPLSWTPVPGARFLAVVGRSGKSTSFVVLFHAIGRDRYSLASSFVMHDEPGPVAFAYSEGIEPRFHFSSCWGCPGETGKVLYRKPDRAVVLQP